MSTYCNFKKKSRSYCERTVSDTKCLMQDMVSVPKNGFRQVRIILFYLQI